MRSINPELRRQIQMQWHAVPILLVPIVTMLLTMGALRHGIRLPIFTGLFLIGTLWGGYRAFHAVREEILQKTWDWQCLSTLSAWTLTWGKLIGCNALVWYSVAWIVFSGWLLGEQLPILGWMSLYCFFAQAISFLLGLLTLSNAAKRWPTIGVLFLLFGLMSYGKIVLSFYQAEQTGTVTWFGHVYGGKLFVLASLLLYGLWAVQGCYVLMARALQTPKTVFSWLFFNLFIVLFIVGFDMSTHIGQIQLAGHQVLTALVLVVVLYSLILIEDLSFILYRKWFLAYQNSDWRKFLVCFPRFLITLFLFLNLGILLCAQENPPPVRWFLASCILYVCRDLLLIMILRLLIKPEKSVVVSLFGLMTVDVFLPMACLLLGYPQWIGGIAPYYSEAYSLEYFASASLQILSLLVFLVYCMRSNLVASKLKIEYARGH